MYTAICQRRGAGNPDPRRHPVWKIAVTKEPFELPGRSILHAWRPEIRKLTPYLNLFFTFHYENLYLENIAVAGDGTVNHGVNKHGEAQARNQSRDDHNGKGALRV